MQNKELLEKLNLVRVKLKEKYEVNGRKPTICSDESLQELAEKIPRTKEELLHITGIGKTFVEKYGDEFLVVLNNFSRKNLKESTMTDEVNATLKRLETRLININKRNRLLYLSKIHNRYSFDLYNTKSKIDIVDFLLGKSLKKEFSATDILENFTKKSKKLDSAERKLLNLIREVSRDARESGQEDLYVGYPFVIGKMRDEDFNVRAPLALFPISFEQKPNGIFFRVDKERDVLYNTNLILTHYKFSNINQDLPNSVIDDVSIDFYENLQKFYAENGIEFPLKLERFHAFKEYKADNFPEYANGEYHIENVAVLGKFSLYSTALQKDFKDIIESEQINRNLNELLLGEGMVDPYSDFEEDEEIELQTEKHTEFKESDLNYINELNTSQENAILSIQNQDKLVIQGPPGTGKSQTITSMIADYVMKGHNVLMVSQKKAALDVIYSRLGNLSKYALFISDVKNKESFYKQMSFIANVSKKNVSLEETLNGIKYINFDNDEYQRIVETIDKDILDLDQIKNALFVGENKNVGMYKIYQENLSNYFLRGDIDITPYEKHVGENLIAIDYNTLKKIRIKFSDYSMSDVVDKYRKLLDENPWLEDVKTGLTREDVKKIIELGDKLEDMQIEHKHLKFLKKLFKKMKIKKFVKKEILKVYFKTYNNLNFFVDKPARNLYMGIEHYDEYSSVKRVISKFKDEEVIYFNALLNIKKENEKENLRDINEKIYDYVIFKTIQRFEATNIETFANIKNYRTKVEEINDLMQRKKELTKLKFEEDLYYEICNNIKDSKKYQDILRHTESTRKPSVQKFIKNYEFELFRGIKIWLMTPEVVSEVLPLKNSLFDLVIFDEASQLYVERGVPVIQRGKKVVIAGDSKQLRPSSLGSGRYETDEVDVEEELGAALEEESLLDLARFRYPEVMLNFHYRSKFEELISFSNYAFYKGKLQVSPNLTLPANPPIEVLKVKNGKWVDQRNILEAERTVELLKQILKERKNKETIGIITFNSKQRDLIMDLIDDECQKSAAFATKIARETDRHENGEDVGLFIKNIENVQGEERDIIIFSLAYAKDKGGKVVRNYGWLNQQGGENRLNVAITRAKRKVYIITSISSSELYVDDLKNNGPKFFKKYIEYAEFISNQNNERAKDVLNSFVDSSTSVETDNGIASEYIDDIYNTLVFNGFDVDRNVGIGDYTLDFAIKKDERYILGIECDSKLYENVSSARKRDIHRQKYYNSMGWNIYRIWTPDWWHNKDQEIEKIRQIIDSVSTK